MIYPPLDHWIWLIPAVMIGACIGSFLNVVIYRVPLGMSVNKPKRSFCPVCKNQLTLLQNLPVVSWLCMLGKKAFGKRAMKFDSAVEWLLKEPEGDQDPMCFVIDGEEVPWWDVFLEKRIA